MTLATSFRSNNHGLQVGHNHGHITAQFCKFRGIYQLTEIDGFLIRVTVIVSTNHEIDRNCIRALGCPDSWAVKNRLKENKDKLLPQSIDWVHQDPQYKSWQDGDEVCLLWIKGGAGKGKTMISIGIIEELLRKESTIVTYFFCQNADYTLNTLEAIMKGLILQLVSQQTALMQSLRSRWDTINNRFDVDVNSWRTLWNIFLEMLEKSKCQRLFVIVDALDECQDDHHMADFLKLIVRNGLDHPAKIKWALTSRPLDHAESQLLAGHEQVRVSLELNSKFVSEAVKMYISSRAQELNILHRYGEALKREIQTELTNKAEGTFLWVSLVCKKLESVCREEALFTIQSLPPGLYPFYDQAFRQLSTQIGETANVRRCMRLLKVMMLAYRPLRLEEVDSVTALTCGEDAISALVHQCASFINLQDRSIAFVHQSARDWLAGEQSIFDTYDLFEHHDISLACLAYLSKWLKENFFELRRPDSTIESLKNVKNVERRALLASMDYAATFWAQHLEHAERTLIRSQITEKGVATIFLQENFLQWVECLGLLEKLPQATEALKALTKLAKVSLMCVCPVQM